MTKLTDREKILFIITAIVVYKLYDVWEKDQHQKMLDQMTMQPNNQKQGDVIDITKK